MALRRDIVDVIYQGTYAEFVSLVSTEDAAAKDGTHGKMDLEGTYLHTCAVRNRPDMAKHLIDLGADVNYRGGVWQATPMTYAADRGHLEVIKLLREHGADFDLYEDARINPLFMAIKGRHLDVVAYFLRSGLDAHVVYRVDHGKLRNALTFARDRGNPQIVSLLLEHGCREPIEGVDQPVWELPRDEWSEELSSSDQIVQYMADRFGSVDTLGLQEVVPVINGMSVAINVIPPNSEHPYLVLFTNGMSDLPVAVPSGQEAWKYAELVMHLPADWVHPQDAGSDERWIWPVQLLRQLAYHPHLNKTWYGPPSAFVATADSPEVLGPNVPQTCVLLIPRFANLRTPLTTQNGHTVNFFTVVPTFTEEREYALRHGIIAFLEKFVEQRVPMTVDLKRGNIF